MISEIPSRHLMGGFFRLETLRETSRIPVEDLDGPRVAQTGDSNPGFFYSDFFIGFLSLRGTRAAVRSEGSSIRV